MSQIWSWIHLRDNWNIQKLGRRRKLFKSASLDKMIVFQDIWMCIKCIISLQSKSIRVENAMNIWLYSVSQHICGHSLSYQNLHDLSRLNHVNLLVKNMWFITVIWNLIDSKSETVFWHFLGLLNLKWWNNKISS